MLVGVSVVVGVVACCWDPTGVGAPQKSISRGKSGGQKRGSCKKRKRVGKIALMYRVLFF